MKRQCVQNYHFSLVPEKSKAPILWVTSESWPAMSKHRGVSRDLAHWTSMEIPWKQVTFFCSNGGTTADYIKKGLHLCQLGIQNRPHWGAMLVQGRIKSCNLTPPRTLHVWFGTQFCHLNIVGPDIYIYIYIYNYISMYTQHIQTISNSYMATSTKTFFHIEQHIK